MRVRKKQCNVCAMNRTPLYRASPNNKENWFFYCIDCLGKIKKNPGYFYGGTWKSEKSRQFGDNN